MNTGPSRRRFCQAAAVGLAAASMPTLRAQPAPAMLRVRKSALELPAGDPIFAKYADAVKKMHALPATDKRNWRRQAEIHADRCVHNGIDFLPWHRHYLNQFEKICGQVIGDPTFALPYWDWSLGRGKIPDAFFDRKELTVEHWNDPGVYDTPNWPDIDTRAIRAIGKGVGVQDHPQHGGSFTASAINSILNETTFSRFNRRLEGTPHNAGHVVVGFPPTGKPGHIGSGLSPLDPLFWLHHCNVDRLWAQWQMAGNTTASFMQLYQGHFVNEAGQSVDVKAADALDFRALGYTYQQFGDPIELLRRAGTIRNIADSGRWIDSFLPANRIEAAAPAALGTFKPTEAVEVGIAAAFEIPVRNLREQLSATRTILDTSLPPVSAIKNGLDEKMLAQFGRPKETSRRIFAHLKGVALESATPPTVNVFLNCPYLSPRTPYTDVHFADSFAFFSHESRAGHDHGGREFFVDLTKAIQDVDLKAAEKLKLQLMAAGPDIDKPVGKFSIQSIEIFSA